MPFHVSRVAAHFAAYDELLELPIKFIWLIEKHGVRRVLDDNQLRMSRRCGHVFLLIEQATLGRSNNQGRFVELLQSGSAIRREKIL